MDGLQLHVRTCNRRLVRNRQTLFVRIVFSIEKQPETFSRGGV